MSFSFCCCVSLNEFQATKKTLNIFILFYNKTQKLIDLKMEIKQQINNQHTNREIKLEVEKSQRRKRPFFAREESFCDCESVCVWVLKQTNFYIPIFRYRSWKNKEPNQK